MKFSKYIFGLLFLILFAVWLAAFSLPGQNLHIVACDVGQGDAILIQKGSSQILLDGGPDDRVLDCLGRYMPFWDRRIELVILTHPEDDHLAGLIGVVRRYKLDLYAEYNQEIGTELAEVLKKEVGGRGVKTLNLTSGTKLRLGKIYLDILHPDIGYQPSAISDTNDLSIVFLLKYGGFKALFTGDISPAVSDQLSVISSVQRIDYVKIPHHGSKNGISQKLLEATKPKVAIISVGKNNPYGHPHQEILKILKDSGVKILRTDKMGDVEIESDGKKFFVKN